jgi:hypothetical protein
VFKSHGQEYLVGNRLSKADVHLAEMVCNMEELDSNILAGFPLLQVISFTALTRWGPASPIVNLVILQFVLLLEEFSYNVLLSVSSLSKSYV